MKALAWSGVILLVLAFTALVGVVFADLWRLAIVPLGAPPITAQQAAVGYLMLTLLASPKVQDRPASAAAIESAARIAGVLVTWGAAYLLMWVLP